jgi:hypothetical protein
MKNVRNNESANALSAIATCGDILSHQCRFTRGNVTTNGCLHDGCCRDQFGSPSEAIERMQSFRMHLWLGRSLNRSNESSRPWTMSDRINLLKTFLFDGRSNVPEPTIRHHIAGVAVCKDFYRKASGFERKMFNKVYESVLSGVVCDVDIKASSRTRKPEEQEEEICAFLDSYFKVNVSLVESDPAGLIKLFLKKRWSELYVQNYIPSCQHLDVKPAKYNIFCAVRKRYRPNFQRSKKVKHGGWSHVRCGECDRLEDCIKKAKDLEEKKAQKELFIHHKEKAKGINCCSSIFIFYFIFIPHRTSCSLQKRSTKSC